MIFRKIKDALALGKNSNRVIIIVGCSLRLPPELEKEITGIEYAMPTREQLMEVLETVADTNGVKLNGNTDKILDAAGGLTARKPPAPPKSKPQPEAANSSSKSK